MLILVDGELYPHCDVCDKMVSEQPVDTEDVHVAEWWKDVRIMCGACAIEEGKCDANTQRDGDEVETQGE